MKNPSFVILIVLLAATAHLPVFAAACRGRVIDPVTAICWRCLFPITIGASAVVGSGLPDTPNPRKTWCVCKRGLFPRVGFSLGYWEPMALVDVTRTPYCLVNLGGLQLPSHQNAVGGGGVVETQTPTQNGSFYEVHVYQFPLLRWLGSWLLGGSCQARGNFEVAYLSELDPTWHDEQLALLAFPETRPFLNPLIALGAQAACLLDSTMANTALPSDAAFWCAGSQGLMYPLTGKVVEHISSVQAGTLLAERALFKLHRLGKAQDTNAKQLCGEQTERFMAKSRYRYQMVYPKAKDCQPFGRSTMRWGGGVMDPLQGDDMGYLIWRKRNCCHWG